MKAIRIQHILVALLAASAISAWADCAFLWFPAKGPWYAPFIDGGVSTAALSLLLSAASDTLVLSIFSASAGTLSKAALYETAAQLSFSAVLVFALIVILVLIRGGAPRYRLDQLAKFGFSSLIPAMGSLAIIALLAYAVL